MHLWTKVFDCAGTGATSLAALWERVTDMGSVGAITRLVTSGEVKSGLRRMFELGLEDRCIDAADGMFPQCFPADVSRAAA